MSTIILDTLQDRVSSTQIAVTALSMPWEHVEYADLTNGGADDLSSYTLSHDFEASYTYKLQWNYVYTTSASAYMGFQFFDESDVLIDGSEYYRSYSVAVSTGLNNNLSTSMSVWNYSAFSGATASELHSGHMYIEDPMDTTSRTSVHIPASMRKSATTCLTCQAACAMANSEGTKGLRFLTSTGTFSGGELWLSRQKELFT